MPQAKNLEISKEEAAMILSALDAIHVLGSQVEKWSALKAKLKSFIPPKVK